MGVLVLPYRSQAITAGDAVLTVAVGTGSGAILGASTMPFYSDSGAHAKNIFYGAAFGAVIGVLFAAYAGVSDGRSGDESHLKQDLIDLKLVEHEESQPLPLDKTYILDSHKSRGALAQHIKMWSPLLDMKF